MSKWKKCVAVLLCAVLLAGLALSAFAAEKPAAADEVIFNLLNMEVIVGSDASRAEGDEPYVLFEKDGSYTIELEPDAFFPYEVQFTCGGVTESRWFETPESTITVGGHLFRVHSEQTDGQTLRQFGVWVGREYVPAYPEAKEFTKEPQIATKSIQPLAEKYLSVNLRYHLRSDIEHVKLSALLNGGSTSVDTAGKAVVWCRPYYDNGKYTIADGETEIDLMQLASGSSSITLEMIVGTADQLDTTNIRYRVYVSLPLAAEIFKVRFADANHKAITPHSTGSSDYWIDNNTRGFRVYASVAREDYTSEPIYGSLSFAEDAVDVEDVDVTIYAGTYSSEEAAQQAKAEDLTEKLWNTDPTISGYLAKYGGSTKEEPVVTAVLKKNEEVLEVLNFKIGMNEDYTRCNWSVYTSGSYRSNISYRTYENEWDKHGYNYWVYYIENEEDVAKNYIVELTARNDLNNNAANNGIELVEKAVLGEFDSLEAAKDAPDIKEALFSDAAWNATGGYETKLDNGVTFSVFYKDGTYDKRGFQVKLCDKQLPSAPTPLSADTYFRMQDASVKREDGDMDSLASYAMPYEHDSYYYNGYQTVFLLDYDYQTRTYSPVTAEEIIPCFYTGSKVNVYAGLDTVSGEKQKSGETAVPFTSGKAIQYSAAAEDGTHLKNYWVTFVTQQTGGPALFVNGATNSAHKDEETGLPVREVILDEAHGNVHDIFFANIGDAEMTGLKVELDAENVKLDDYWTIGETKTLAPFTSTSAKEYGSDWSSASYGELRNVAKLRLVPTESAGVISGTLTISADGVDPVVIKLTGISGIPEITTTEIVPGVKYVPYSSVIMTNSMAASDSISFEIADGTLPAGVILKPNGEIYGVPQVVGSFDFTVKMTYTASDGQTYTDEASYTLTIADNTNQNVWNATDNNYEIIDPVGAENGSYNFVLDTYEDQLFWTNGKFDYFIDFWLDGRKLVNGVDYDATSGSTKITIRSQTFRNAGAGTHTIAAEFREGDPVNGTLKRAAQNYTMKGGSFTPGGNVPGSKDTDKSNGSTASTGLPFADVPANAWYFGDVKWAYDNQLMIGSSGTLFSPNSAVSQATIVTVLARMANVDLSRFEQNPYPSIPNGKWYTRAAVWAKQTGILPTAEFGGEDPIGRGDMAIMLVNYMQHLGMNLKAPAQPIAFSDADQMTAKQNDAFQILYSCGVFKGMGNREMAPARQTTRAQFAALVNRIDTLIKN